MGVGSTWCSKARVARLAAAAFETVKDNGLVLGARCTERRFRAVRPG